MKTRIIILLSLAFSSLGISSTYASELGNLFDIPYGIEGYKLEMQELQDIRFENTAVGETYDRFISLNNTLKQVLIDRYRQGEIEYYQVQDAISSYNDFVFYTQKAFQYISLEEKINRSTETQKAIYNAYSNMRVSYVRFLHELEK